MTLLPVLPDFFIHKRLESRMPHHKPLTVVMRSNEALCFEREEVRNCPSRPERQNGLNNFEARRPREARENIEGELPFPIERRARRERTHGVRPIAAADHLALAQNRRVQTERQERGVVLSAEWALVSGDRVAVGTHQRESHAA